MPKLLIATVGVALLGLSQGSAATQAPRTAGAPTDPESWPREVVHPNVTVLIYEPQVERLTQNEVEARAAVQVSQNGKPPAFGAIWISAHVDVDRDARRVMFREVRVPKVRFVDATDSDRDAIAHSLEQEIPNWNLEMDLDRFIPLLTVAEHENPRAVALKHDPPRIMVATVPTTLIVVDGTPRRQTLTTPQAAAQEKLERVINTPAVIIYHPARKRFYLAAGGDLWYEAPDVMGPYRSITSVPPVVAGLVPKTDPSEPKATGTPPAIVIATEPTELIVLRGSQPQYALVDHTHVLAVSNADRDILVAMDTHAHYVLLSGRWYKSATELNGPWTFVPPPELPAEFSKISETSAYGHLRAHVPGTVEAQEALLDELVPQTQAIRRDDASLTVTYDGTPSFRDIEGTTLQYAVNTPQSVFKVGNRYYACQQGVWYDSATPSGPWTVSTGVPTEIYGIPPSNPHYNVTYVRVYDVTPQVVYVGYTPGYLCAYPYGGTIVYGTGWYYPGWVGTAYYPRPTTWGFNVSYNSYYGWGFGVSYSSGPLSVSIGFGGWGSPGWWGPAGYRPYYPPVHYPVYPGYRPPYYPGYRPPGYPGYVPPANGQRPGTPVQLPASARAGQQPRDGSLYHRAENSGRNQPGVESRNRVQPTATQGPNNVYSAPNGDVMRRNPAGSWDQRQGGNWRASPGATSPVTPPARSAQPGGTLGSGARPSGGLNGDFAARQRGTERSSGAPRQAPGATSRRGGRQ